MINRRNNDGDGYRTLQRIGKTQLAVHFAVYEHRSPEENPGLGVETLARRELGMARETHEEPVCVDHVIDGTVRKSLTVAKRSICEFHSKI